MWWNLVEKAWRTKTKYCRSRMRFKKRNRYIFSDQNLRHDCQRQRTCDAMDLWKDARQRPWRIGGSGSAQLLEGPLHWQGDHDHVDSAQGQHDPRARVHDRMGQRHSGRADQTCRRQAALLRHPEFEWVEWNWLFAFLQHWKKTKWHFYFDDCLPKILTNSTSLNTIVQLG